MSLLLDMVHDSPRLRPRTKLIYLHAIERFLAYAGNEPARWTPSIVQAWRKSLLEEEPPLSEQTANVYLRGLCYATRRLELMDLGRDFARAVEPVRIEQEETPQGLSWPEVYRLLATTSDLSSPINLRDRTLLIVCIRCGGRRASELASFAWEDIHGRIGTFEVKGGRRLDVELDDEVLAALHQWRSFCGNPTLGRVFQSLRLTASDAWQLGGGLTRQTIWSIVSERASQARLRHVHPHMLRHTYITLWLADGVPPPVVMRQAGHKSLDMTSRYIDHARADVVSVTARSLLSETVS